MLYYARFLEVTHEFEKKKNREWLKKKLIGYR